MESSQNNAGRRHVTQRHRASLRLVLNREGDRTHKKVTSACGNDYDVLGAVSFYVFDNLRNRLDGRFLRDGAFEVADMIVLISEDDAWVAIHGERNRRRGA